jgi:hypothetical protein
MPHRFVATRTRFVIIRAALRSTMKIGSILLVMLALSVAASSMPGQSDDPSETFLKAYMTAQQGEKLEHENQFKAALAKYRFAGSLIEQVRKNSPDWQPSIVEYRGRKISEGILRVQDKSGTQEGVTAPVENPAPVAVMPAKNSPAPFQVSREKERAAPAPPQPVQLAKEKPTLAPSPPVQVAKEKVSPAPAAIAKPSPASTPNEVAIQQATKKLEDKIEQLEADLVKSRTKMSEAEAQKQSLNSRLDETKSNLDKAKGDLAKAKTTEKEVREQLNLAQASLKKTAEAGSNDSKAQEALKGEIAQLKKVLSSAQEGRTVAEKERDEANAQTKGLKETQKRVEVLVAENSNLKQKLADAEKTVREISADKPKKEQELAEVKKQITDLQAQLAASQKQNKDYEITVAQLRTQLDDASKHLDQVKLVGATPEETAKLTKENEMLRNIIVRERQEEARRDQAKKLLLAEFG